MKLEVKVGGRTRSVEVVRAAGGGKAGLRLRLDGRVVEVDAVEVDAATYSILLEGQSYEVRINPAETGMRVQTRGREFPVVVRDPRQWRGRGAAMGEIEGRQNVAAPMPGKVVRVLVEAGQEVTAGQGLLVVEAMKMQNEIRSPKTGKVERLLVKEGQNVETGEALAVVG